MRLGALCMTVVLILQFLQCAFFGGMYAMLPAAMPGSHPLLGASAFLVIPIPFFILYNFATKKPWAWWLTLLETTIVAAVLLRWALPSSVALPRDTGALVCCGLTTLCMLLLLTPWVRQLFFPAASIQVH